MPRRSTGIRQAEDGTWIIDKVVLGQRIFKRTGSNNRQLAETFLATREAEIRRGALLGERQKRTFREAALRYVEENAHKRGIAREVLAIKQADPFIGETAIDRIYSETLEPMKKALAEKGAKKKTGLKARSINIILDTVARILKQAARRWRDENGQTWLAEAPIIDKLPETDKRQAYPLSWAEQKLLLSEMDGEIAKIALFLLNSGAREQEPCKLQWDWEVPIPELGTSVFVVPADFGGRSEAAGVKNGEDHLIVMNSVAKSVIDGQRGKDDCYVFPSPKLKGGKVGPRHRLNNSGWRNGRKRAAERYRDEIGKEAPEGFKYVRVHDLKHTYGRRMRAAGIAFETRQVLLGHTNGSVTTHYSAAEIKELIDAAERVCFSQEDAPTLTLIVSNAKSRKTHAGDKKAVA
ncbi:tyrosine-type recombinase/integrase [Azospira restricta]|uniref:Tyrosine-type recombinase/integrase n=1 Tax=Azospira restricta TaxID=404405 RepID=A0A974PW07_9RHOO|nr:tyrosine-type recombinase/integrase [Azospira restricta]QRJ62537.1 tyrosine-type recombinase/integrase [Azospira restricta]